jgi:hypothetical protein
MLTKQEIEKAINVDRNTYPGEMPCIICGHRWMQHMGTLCPHTPGGYIIVDGMLAAVKPIFQEETTFLPDMTYYNQNPDFDVV